MGNFKLNLPTDIPWKRKCVSEDMLDKKFCDASKPFRWRSSIAVFEYEPDEENQNYEGLIISYLKVSCSITGYQENPDEIGLDIRGLRSFWGKRPGIEDYLDVLQQYYPCYGAVLEVSVTPKDANTPLSKFPYFMDFEPKKRELYELVSDTGETVSRSLSNIEVGKSNTSLKSHEIVDVDKGWRVATAADSPFGGGSSDISRQFESGTRDMTQDQSAHLRNTNTSQEMRETQSHTTILSQMYHQLDSYHIGTNRALFFIHPRPHIIETEHTFVNGPRNIEGIQDFLLVVARPKEVKSICVETYLETGHIAKITSATTTETVPGTERVVFYDDEFRAMYTWDEETPNFDNSAKIWEVNDHYPGYEIISASISLGTPEFIEADEGPSISELIDEHPNISLQDSNLVRVSGSVHSFYENVGIFARDNRAGIRYPFTVEITIARNNEIRGEENVLFITGRRLCCCAEKKETSFPGIVYEKPDFLSNKVKKYTLDSENQVPLNVANKIGYDIKKTLIRSRTDSEHRYVNKSIDLPQTNFANKTLSTIIDKDNNTSISKLTTLKGTIRNKIIKLDSELRVKDVITMPFQMQKDLFDLDDEEILELRNHLIGYNHKYDPKTVWLSEKQLSLLKKLKKNIQKKGSKKDN